MCETLIIIVVSGIIVTKHTNCKILEVDTFVEVNCLAQHFEEKKLIGHKQMLSAFKLIKESLSKLLG